VGATAEVLPPPVACAWAVLDLDVPVADALGHRLALLLCDLLEEKGIPFVLTSGYADWQIPAKWDDRPRLQKPYTLDQVGHALGRALNAFV